MREHTLRKLIDLSREDYYQRGQIITNGYRLVHSRADVDVLNTQTLERCEIIVRPPGRPASRHRVREHAVTGFCRGIAAGLSAGENW